MEGDVQVLIETNNFETLTIESGTNQKKLEGATSVQETREKTFPLSEQQAQRKQEQIEEISRNTSTQEADNNEVEEDDDADSSMLYKSLVSCEQEGDKETLNELINYNKEEHELELNDNINTRGKEKLKTQSILLKGLENNRKKQKEVGVFCQDNKKTFSHERPIVGPESRLDFFEKQQSSAAAATATADNRNITFDNNKQQTGATSVLRQQLEERRLEFKERSSLLKALLEGRKSWPEHRTVIVEIKNGQKIITEKESDLVLSCFKKKQALREEGEVKKCAETSLGTNKKREFLSKSLSEESKKSFIDDSLNSNNNNNNHNNKTTKSNRDAKTLASKQKLTDSNKNRPASKENIDLNSTKKVNNNNQIEEEEKERKENLSSGKKEKKKEKTIEELDNKEVVVVVDVENKSESLENIRSKGTKPPTFGTIPYKLTSRLPYFSYFGKARNVNLISSENRKKSITNKQDSIDDDNNHQQQIIAQKYRKKKNSSSGGDLSGSISTSSSSQRSLVSPSASSVLSLSTTISSNTSSSSRIPLALTRISRVESQAKEIDLNTRNRKTLNSNGYSNISNLFPGKPMKVRGVEPNTSNSSNNLKATGRLSSSISRDSGFVGGGRYNRQSSSLLNLNNLNNYSTPLRVRSSSNNNNHSNTSRSRPSSAAAAAAAALAQQEVLKSYYLSSNSRRKSTSGDNQYNPSDSFRNKSLYSLNGDVSGLAKDFIDDYIPQQTFRKSTMRRQNSNVGTGGSSGTTMTRVARQNYQGRPSSAAGGGNYNVNNTAGLRNYRSPSASSLYYGGGGGGSAGMSPYGGYDYRNNPTATLLDPDCPVHGYSPVSGGPVGGRLQGSGMTRSTSQQLAGGVGPIPPMEADLLYDPYPVGGAGGGGAFGITPYYDRPINNTALLHKPASLYSPTSPQFRAGYNTKGAGGNPLGGAYYNNTSRFSMFQPEGNRIMSSLAPPNEQLRRILGYQPQTKPIHLHPQWAYSRPFIHLQGANNNNKSSRSPLGGADDDNLDDDDDQDGDDDDEIKPRFEAYNQLHDAQAIRAVDFHPSGEVYAIGSNSRALRICAYPADHELRHFNSQVHVTSSPKILFKFLQVHRGSIYCVSFNSTGQLLATGSNDQTVHIVRYNSTTHSPDGDEYRLTMHDGTIRDLCFIDDTTNGSSLLLSAGGGDNKIYVTDCDTITPFQSMAGHTQMVMALNHWSGASFVSASYDRTIRFWDLRTRNCTSIISAPPSFNETTIGKWAGPGAPVCSVRVDPSGRLLASGHSDATCMLYDIRGAKIIQAFKPHDDEIRTLSFSPKSYYLLTAGYDGRIVLTDLQGDLTQPLPSVCVAECDDKIVQSKWHPSDFTFVTTSADKTATLWALPTE